VTVLLGLVVGAGALRLLLMVMPDVLRSPILSRVNHRGKVVATAGGLFAVLAILFVEGGRVGLGTLGVGDDPGLDATRQWMLFTCVGFCLLGLFDDLLATGREQGFSGHVRALVRGRVTTGLVKLVGGGALALVIAAAPGPEGRLRLFVDTALIALAANLSNLFDRAPGRAIKVGVVAWIPLAILAAGDAVGVAIAPVIGAFVALLPDDLGERVMLGDAGAMALGAALGLAAVLETSPTTRVVIVAVLLVLNVVSEWVSFGRVIHRVPVLRRLDELGTRTRA
jgi:UDP-GlcNAc:undecaprenyl-phosphate GlcNAc-1-phosphate transferase